MSEGPERPRGPLDFEPDPAPAGNRDAPVRPRRTRPPGPATSKYVWVIGVGAVVLIGALLISTVRNGTGRGSRGVPVGDVMPAFAAPLAVSDLDGDVNLALGTGEGEAGHRPACSVRGPRVLNGCVLRERGPVVLAFFATRGRQCVEQLDLMERVRRRVPGVQFAAISIRGDRAKVRGLVRSHRWGFPVGYDRDGALSNTYHVQVCPQLTFARRGGRVVETAFGELTEAELAGKAARLIGR